MSYVTLRLMTPSIGILSSLVLEPFFQRAQTLRRSALAEPRPFTGYEPQKFAENKDHRHFTGDKQLTEHEDLRVKPLSFHQPITASTYDSAESIATPPQDSD